MDRKVRELAQQVARKLASEGLLLAAGWQIYRAMALQDVQDDATVDRYKEAFEAGAQHLFGSIMDTLDPGQKETPADLRRMALIDAELRPITERLELKYLRAKGRG